MAANSYLPWPSKSKYWYKGNLETVVKEIIKLELFKLKTQGDNFTQN